MNKQIAEFDMIKDIGKVIHDTLKPCKVYLFGSFAKGTQNDDSDYDFYVIVDDSVEDTYFLAGKAYRAIYDYDCRDVDLLVMREKTFNKRKGCPSFIENAISNEGIAVYE